MRTLVISLLLLTAASTAEAGDKNKKKKGEDSPKRFSVGASMGIVPDMASLGATITQDGTVDTADSTVANAIYSTDKALMSDRNNLAIWYNSQNTDSGFKLLGANPVLGGPMLGLEVGGDMRYELDDVINFPLYVEAGFHYSSKMSGGHQERQLGTVAEDDPTVGFLFGVAGLDPADYDGGVMKNTYDASWVEIPFRLGIKVPHPKRPYTFAYGGMGVSYFSGGFSVELDIDERYANALSTHIDGETYEATNYSPGAVKDKIDFKGSGMGINYGLGVQAGTKAGFAFFGEMNSSGMADTVYSNTMADSTQQLLTATSSETLTEFGDDHWFKRLAFPVVMRGASFRMGVRYYFF